MSAIDEVLATQTQLLQAKPQLNSLKQSCEGMESAFLKQMVTLMRKSTGDVHFGKDLGGDMYKDMFDGSIADELAQKGTLGIAKSMFASVAPRVLNQTISRIRAAQATQKSAAVSAANGTEAQS